MKEKAAPLLAHRSALLDAHDPVHDGRELDGAQESLLTGPSRIGRTTLISATWIGLVATAGRNTLISAAGRLVAIARGLIAGFGLFARSRRTRTATAAASLVG